MAQRVTYLKMRQATSSLGVRLVALSLFLLLFWWGKSWFFGWLGEVTGVVFFETIASVGFLFWLSVLIWGGLVLGLVVRWYSVVYEIYTDRIVLRSGLIARRVRAVSMSDFSQVQTQQGVWGRILKYGTIEFMYRTIGPTGGFGETFYNIASPDKVSEQLRSLLRLAGEDGNAEDAPVRADEQHKQDAETMAAAEQAEEGREDTETLEAEAPDNVDGDEGIRGEIQL